MECPQRKRLVSNDSGGTDEIFLPCSKEACGWWSEEMNQCDPLGIQPWLMHIEGHLAALAGKSPHKIKG